MSNYAIPIRSDGAPIAQTSAAIDANNRILAAILVHLNTAPVTSEELVVGLDAAAGANFDTVIFTQDLIGVTDVAYTDIEFPLQPGDALRVTYANTDHRAIGISLLMD